MKFWDDGQPDSTRIRNVNFSWNELKKLQSFLSVNGVVCSANLYDFSPEKLIDESIHIPYPLGVYKKAEKTNCILKQQRESSFFMMIDCDAFFYEKDYEKLLEILRKLNRGDIITFDLAKLHDRINEYLIDGTFIIENSDWSYAYSGKRENGPLSQSMGGLGGVYICDTELLTSLGGFDNSYEGWGGEDGDMLNRIMISGKEYKVKPTRNFAPFHLPHYTDWGNINYYKRKG